MIRPTIIAAIATTIAGGLAMLPVPAAAQQSSSNITVFGSDPCPRSTDNRIYVCNRRPESERYRLPKSQQLQGTRQQNQSWSRQAQALTTVGNTGAQSCSAVGPGGFTGCLTQEINQAKKETRERADQDQAPQ